MLDTTARTDRVEAWTALVSASCRDRQALPEGIELRFALHATSELEELVAAERECCGWAIWQLSIAEDVVVLRATASAEPGPAVLQELFGL
jgi:hypothetical protein